MQYLRFDIKQPAKYLSCGQFVSEGPWIHSRRIIDSYELIIGIKGIVYIQQDEEQYCIGPGNILLLLPGHIHKGWQVSEGAVSFYWMHFKCTDEFEVLEEEKVLDLLSSFRLSQYSNNFKDSALIPTVMIGRDTDRLIVQFRQFLHSANSGYYTPYALDYFLTLILIEVSQQTIDFISSKINHEGSFRIETILEWIRIHIRHEINITEMASIFGFNKDYFSRIFKKYTGVSPVKYINTLRLLKAKELLCGTEMSVKEIAFSLGFNDEKYFIKLFSKSESLSPTNYRHCFFKTHLNNR